MPRNMSCMKTIPQVLDHSKDVTRRLGWLFLKPGDVLNLVEKCQGLKRGEKVVHLATVKVISTRAEELCAITQEDVVREGFPDMTPGEFVEMFMAFNDCRVAGPFTVVNRIRFEYLGN